MIATSIRRREVRQACLRVQQHSGACESDENRFLRRQWDNSFNEGGEGGKGYLNFWRMGRYYHGKCTSFAKARGCLVCIRRTFRSCWTIPFMERSLTWLLGYVSPGRQRWGNRLMSAREHRPRAGAERDSTSANLRTIVMVFTHMSTPLLLQRGFLQVSRWPLLIF